MRAILQLMKRRFVLFATICLLASLLCPAQEAKPNFTGKWVLDVGKSEFGGLPIPNSRTDVVDHKDPSLAVSITTKGPASRGERVAELKYTTDGKENTNDVRGTETKSKTRWEGKRLIIEGKAQMDGEPVELKEVWELSEGGKVRTLVREVKNSFDRANQKLIFRKE